MKEQPRKDERFRVEHLVGLIFCSVAGFNLVLLYNHAIRGNWGWFIIVLLVCVLFPGLIPYFNLVRALREGDLMLRWQEPFGVAVGAIDSVAILSHWPDALIDVSWVSTFIIGTAAAFFLIVQSR
ncbi:MAG: hypothetical protein KGL31_08060 [candidate division NC10 bacterium]|nr:hypothetical protein [candidate division NC10 bacterium]MDE2321852.1 hypothetical protein [candidate division NC10 bacterium]